MQSIFQSYHCLLCHKTAGQQRICHQCHLKLPWLGDNTCHVCARLIPIGSRCGPCSANPPPYQTTQALFRYEQPITRWIHQLKFSRRYTHAHWLGELIANFLLRTNKRPDYLIPVPLHWKRRFSRGYNQSLEIAKSISKISSIPIEKKCCVRQRATHPQAKLHPKERKKNLRHAFVCRRSLQGKHIALIDDVITTGNTVASLSQVLKASGAEQIDVYAIARAIPSAS